MVTVRRFEEMVVALRSGTFVPAPGFRYVGATHLCIGQEAVAAEALASLFPPRDRITSTHRGHGHAVAHGLRLLSLLDDRELEAFVEQPSWHTELAPKERTVRWHLYRMFSELLGQDAGYCRGRGGSMHIADIRRGHLGATALRRPTR